MKTPSIHLGIALAVAAVTGCSTAPDDSVCDATLCVSPSAVSANISAAVDGKVVGYVSYVGTSTGIYAAGGDARTSADAPTVDFGSSTVIQVASVSKTPTALAAVSVLAEHGIALSSPMGPYLPPDWNVSSYVAAITFEQLLSHTSGIHDTGDDTAQDDADVEQELESLKGPLDPSYTYSNYNYSLFRILLPIVDGFNPAPSSDRSTQLAENYVSLVQQRVYEPVGLTDIECKPPAGSNTYALSYLFPGTQVGYDSGDMTLSCGRAGWYLSALDLVAILGSFNAGDGKIVTRQQASEMTQNKLGWDSNMDMATGYPWLSKPGDWNSSGGQWLHTAIGIFGPGVIGVLLFNSDLEGSPGDTTDTATTILLDAFVKAAKPKT